MVRFFKNIGKTFFRNEEAVAAVEAAMMFPTLIMMLVSMIDIGNGILANQKLISAAQTTADLIARESNPTLSQRADAVLAGQLAMAPYPLDSYGYSVVSLRFNEDGGVDIVWQESSGISIDPSVIDDTTDLGSPGEGVLVVRTEYTYEPFFTGFVIGPIRMEEVAYVRGRKSSVIGGPLEDGV